MTSRMRDAFRAVISIFSSHLFGSVYFYAYSSPQ
jgi:hypothetical protein